MRVKVPVVQTANLFSFSITSLVQLIVMGSLAGFFYNSTSLLGIDAGLGLAKLFRVAVWTRSRFLWSTCRSITFWKNRPDMYLYVINNNYIFRNGSQELSQILTGPLGCATILNLLTLFSMLCFIPNRPECLCLRVIHVREFPLCKADRLHTTRSKIRIAFLLTKKKCDSD